MNIRKVQISNECIIFQGIIPDIRIHESIQEKSFDAIVFWLGIFSIQNQRRISWVFDILISGLEESQKTAIYWPYIRVSSFKTHKKNRSMF